jgi:hypothetical protein
LARAGIGDIAYDGDRPIAGLAGRVDQTLAPTGEECHPMAAATQADCDAAAEATRGADHGDALEVIRLYGYSIDRRPVERNGRGN